MLTTFGANQWDTLFSSDLQSQAVENIENGHILCFPELPFTLLENEKRFLTPECADPKAKNVGYSSLQNRLWGVQRLSDTEHQALKAMLERYARYSYTLVAHLLPSYVNHMKVGRTSYRPIQVSNRKSSYRKDDKRLHVDAFPSSPNQGQRILRVFCNINPNNEDRVWRIGEPFEQVANRFLPKIPKPFPGVAALLRFLKITKSYRTPYDHYMLQMHDRMKADEWYQKNADQQEVRFPSGTTWIVQTDHVSHAAMQGQFLLEQTFYLPVNAMQDPSRAPLRVLERLLNRPLL